MGLCMSVMKASARCNAADIKCLPLPETVNRKKILWSYAIPVCAFHLLLPLAFVPWLFSWTGLILVPLGNYIFCSLGIGAGYHRLLTHRGFLAPKWLERTLAVLGVCCLQDSPARWVLIHRLHHQHSDDQPDPHSPMVNFLWGHFAWVFVENRQYATFSSYEKYVRDLLQDPFYMRLERRIMWVWVYVAHAVLFYLAGFAIGWATTGEFMGGVQFGLSLLLWGVVIRTIYTWHVTWGVNSATHMWGYRNYETDRRQPQQLVGRPAHLRRRLAQQPPRLSAHGPPRPSQVVGARRHLPDDLALGARWASSATSSLPRPSG